MEDNSNIHKTGKGKKKALTVNKDRFISKMFLGEDSVIIVLRNPKNQSWNLGIAVWIACFMVFLWNDVMNQQLI